jgi:hypothetical protein
MEQNALVCRQVETVTGTLPHYTRPGDEPVGPHGPVAGPPQPNKGKARTALIWSIGGTVLSGVGFIVLALFEQYNDSLTELRHDLKHFNEMSADLVKKEGLRRCMGRVKTCLKELEATHVARIQLQHELRANDQERKELNRELQRLRERLAMVEGRQAATPIVLPTAPGKK